MPDARRRGGQDAKAYEDYRQLLDNAASFDAVLVGTPDHWHAPLCKAFMKAGKHVYCEKPLTHSVAEARELRELARTCGGRHADGQPGQRERFAPPLHRNHSRRRAGPDSRDLPVGYRRHRE